jgi:hypothetical protein
MTTGVGQSFSFGTGMQHDILSERLYAFLLDRLTENILGAPNIDLHRADMNGYDLISFFPNFSILEIITSHFSLSVASALLRNMGPLPFVNESLPSSFLSFGSENSFVLKLKDIMTAIQLFKKHKVDFRAPEYFYYFSFVVSFTK